MEILVRQNTAKIDVLFTDFTKQFTQQIYSENIVLETKLREWTEVKL